MKNFNAKSIPSLFNILNIDNNMDYYATEFNIPNPKFGVNYYGNVNGSIYNVFRVDAVAIHNSGADMTSEMFIHTPDGKRHTISLNSGGAENYLNYFEKKEDFMEYSLNGSIENRMPHITLQEYLKDAEDCYTIDYGGYNGNTFHIKGFYWQNGMVKAMNAYFDLAWRDRDGLHIVFGNDLYTTKEECFNKSFILVSGEFPEDEPKMQVYKVSVTLDLEITAESEEAAREMADRKIAYLEE